MMLTDKTFEHIVKFLRQTLADPVTDPAGVPVGPGGRISSAVRQRHQFHEILLRPQKAVYKQTDGAQVSAASSETRYHNGYLFRAKLRAGSFMPPLDLTKSVRR